MDPDTQDQAEVGDDYGDVFNDDPGVLPENSQPNAESSTAGPPAATTTDAPSSLSADPPAPADSQAPGSQPAVDGAAGVPVAAPVDSSPFQRPPDAVPFNFRVDRTEVQVDGAWVSPDGQHIVIPRNAWDSQMRPYLANRGEWNNRERGYRDRIQELETSSSGEVEQARAVLKQFDDLMQKGPEAVAKWMDDFDRNAPLLKAEAEKLALRQQLEAKNARESQHAEEQRWQQEVPRMQNQLGGALEGMLKDPRFAVLAGTPDENVALLKDLWQNHADAFFVRADRDYPEYGIPKGTMVFQSERLEQWMAREAARFSVLISRSQKATEAKSRNHAALQPSKPFAPKAPAPAAPAPSPQKPATTPAPQNDYEAWKEKTMRDDNWADVLE